MPPKPPLRLPIKAASAIKPKAAPPVKAPRLLPRSGTRKTGATTIPTPPPRSPQWHTDSNLRNSARLLIWGANGVFTICALLWVRDHYAEIQHVRGSSMAPTLSPTAHETGIEDWVVIRPYTERAASQKKNQYADLKEDEQRSNGLKRGDVVTFWKPHKPEEMGIKRVVALEGDTVFPVRGYAVEDRKNGDGEGRVRGIMDGFGEVGEEGDGRVVVPYGHVWLEGDNWRKSLDSNDFGPVSKGLILGKAIWVWRSWFRFEAIGDGRLKSEKGQRSKVVRGRSEVPAVFLE